MKKKRQDTAANAKPVRQQEQKLSRRNAIKSLTAGTLALGISAAAPEALAQKGMNVCGTPEGARKFLEGLLDPKVREQFQRNPQRVMAGYGFNVPRALIPREVQLPSEADVRKLLDVMNNRGGSIDIQPAGIIFIVFIVFIAFIAFSSKAHASIAAPDKSPTV